MNCLGREREGREWGFLRRCNDGVLQSTGDKAAEYGGIALKSVLMCPLVAVEN